MRCRYREVAYLCSENFIDLQVYPEYELPRFGGRRKKAKPTSDVQMELNIKNKKRRIARLLNTNFSENDIRLDLTYEEKHLPQDIIAAETNVKNYIRRLKTYAVKHGIELKYIWVTEQGSKSGRFHHHMVLTGGIPLSVLAEKWGRGYTTVKPLQFNELGITALANYLMKSPVASGKATYHPSRNLQEPIRRTRSGRISRRQIEFMSTYTDSSVLERLYPGYKVVNISPYYNDVNGGFYFDVQLFKRGKRR